MPFDSAVLEQPITDRDLRERSMHYVEGHTSKTENPHLYRMATYKSVPTGPCSTSYLPVKLSPAVTAWLKSFDDPDMSAEDAAIAARLAALPEPAWLASVKAYRTHAQEMSAFYRQLDKANKGTRLEWRPISEERSAFLSVARTGRTGPQDWTEAAREKTVVAARKRGDIVHTTERSADNA